MLCRVFVDGEEVIRRSECKVCTLSIVRFKNLLKDKTVKSECKVAFPDLFLTQNNILWKWS